MNIGLNQFVERQCVGSKFSYYMRTWEELKELVVQNFDKAEQGYRLGVLLVPVPADDFVCGVVRVVEHTELHAELYKRRDGEAPYVQVTATRADRLLAKHVQIVLYSHELLKSAGDNSTDAEWEIISINASDVEDEPMSPVTMARNQLGESGGTKAEYTAEEFARSIWYWKDRVMLK